MKSDRAKANLRAGHVFIVMTNERQKRYEAILKQADGGGLQRSYFDQYEAAQSWLFRRWLELCGPLIEGQGVAAIYDQHYSRKRVFEMGALSLLANEREVVNAP